MLFYWWNIQTTYWWHRFLCGCFISYLYIMYFLFRYLNILCTTFHVTHTTRKYISGDAGVCVVTVSVYHGFFTRANLAMLNSWTVWFLRHLGRDRYETLVWWRISDNIWLYNGDASVGRDFMCDAGAQFVVDVRLRCCHWRSGGLSPSNCRRLPRKPRLLHNPVMASTNWNGAVCIGNEQSRLVLFVGAGAVGVAWP